MEIESSVCVGGIHVYDLIVEKKHGSIFSGWLLGGKRYPVGYPHFPYGCKVGIKMSG